MEDKRKPVEVRKVGTVVFRKASYYLRTANGLYERLPWLAPHFIDTETEVIFRQVKPNPAAAH